MRDMGNRHLTEEQRKILKQALWDMTLSPEEFLDIIEGATVRKWPDRAFCVARFLESVNWFDIVKITAPQKICDAWHEARRYVRFKSIRDGMDFACRLFQ